VCGCRPRPDHRRHVDAGFHLSQHRLPDSGQTGQQGAAAFDVQAVCAGFTYALGIAEKFIRSGSHKKALVIGAKSFRAFSTGATVAPACCSAMVPAQWCSKRRKAGNPGHCHACRWQPERHPERTRADLWRQVTGDPFLRMDGQAVFKFAVRVLAEVAEEVCIPQGCRPPMSIG
jgi:3-oxoacyl-[acyl-carrier-protein] synthase-3